MSGISEKKKQIYQIVLTFLIKKGRKKMISGLAMVLSAHFVIFKAAWLLFFYFGWKTIYLL